MPKIPVRQFKGLLTYADLADSNLEYSNIFKDILVYPGYLESKRVGLSEINFPYIPSNEEIVSYKFVFLDIDKFQNQLEGILLKRVYSQNITKKELIVTEKTLSESQSEYKIYLDSAVLEETHTGIPSQMPYIENINGIVKIFFKERSYWLSHYNRISFFYRYPGFHLPPNGNRTISGYKLKPLIYSYEEGNWFPFGIQAVNEDSDTIFGNLEFVGRTLYEDNGLTFAVSSFRIKDSSGQTITYPSRNGLLNFILARHREYDNEFYFLINKREKDIIKNLTDKLPSGPGSGSAFNFYRTMEPDWLMYEAPSGESFYYVQTDNFDDYSMIPLNGWEFSTLKLQSYSNDYKFNAATKSSFLVTINTSQGEFVHSVKDFGIVGSDHIYKVWALNTETLPEETIQINLYISTVSILFDNDVLDKREYEMVWSIPLVEGKTVNFPYYINKLSPSGIMLSQRIGTLFNKFTYKIVDGFDHYKTINGISFAVKDDKVYFPTVGNGKVLNNIFYEYNYIPNIEGQILSVINNRLAIIDVAKNITQIIDYQPVEGNMIFIPVANYELNVKNYFDIIESPEGVILNTSEGLLVVNSEGRQFISNQIKDIVKTNFNKSSIFYNTFLKELYYTYDDELYVYRIETQSWSYMTGLQKNEYIIKNVADDYDGNFYFLVKNRRGYKLFKLDYIDSVGTIGYRFLDFNENSYKKSLLSISFDHRGEILFDGKKRLSLQRKVDNIPLSFLKRKYKDYIEFDFSFKGKLYSFEISIDVTPYIKY